jgi:FkbM family methyltransferase
MDYMNKFFSIFNLRLTRINKDKKVKSYYTGFGIAANSFDYNPKTNSIQLYDIGLKLDADKYKFFLEGYSIVKKLKEKLGAVFTLDDKENISVSINDLKINLQTWEELFILDEVFINGVYNFKSKEDFVFIDIGMNVGITSLYFSVKKNVKKIYAFEPFTPTFDQACLNIKQNKKEAIIQCFNFGLSDEDKTLSLDYDPKHKGNMGKNGIPSHLQLIGNEVRSEKIILKNIEEVFKKILDEDSTHRIVCKIDCEGAEYEIISKLSTSNLLKKIDVLFLEWHFKGPDAITLALLEQNYNLFSFDEFNEAAGMVYAFKK